MYQINTYQEKKSCKNLQIYVKNKLYPFFSDKYDVMFYLNTGIATDSSELTGILTNTMPELIKKYDPQEMLESSDMDSML